MFIKKCERCEEYYGDKNKICSNCGFENDNIEKGTNVKNFIGLLTIGVVVSFFFNIKSLLGSKIKNTHHKTINKRIL